MRRMTLFLKGPTRPTFHIQNVQIIIKVQRAFCKGFEVPQMHQSKMTEF